MPTPFSIEHLSFNEAGLIPAIAQDANTLEVLMMAWMNKEAVEETLRTGRVCYWSRSRCKLWRKGETSGQHQKLQNFRFDCDRDTILLRVTQTGVACHTGRRSCFYHQVEDQSVETILSIEVDPNELYNSENTSD